MTSNRRFDPELGDAICAGRDFAGSLGIWGAASALWSLLPAHSLLEGLQWQLELGLPGSLLGLGIIAWTLSWPAWRAPLAPDRRAGALALASAALTVGMLSFGVWQSWWLSTLWLVIALGIAAARSADRAA